LGGGKNRAQSKSCCRQTVGPPFWQQSASALQRILPTPRQPQCPSTQGRPSQQSQVWVQAPPPPWQQTSGGGWKMAHSLGVCWHRVSMPDVVQHSPVPEQIAPVRLQVAARQAPSRQIWPLGQ
jgi:hypothetical protein